MTDSKKPTLRLLSLGAGVQSTTLYLMSCLGELPRLDAAIFADTGWEPKVVYDHLEWLQQKSEKYGIPIYTVSAGNIREDALRSKVRGVVKDGDRWVSMPYRVRNDDGSIGMIKRQCTREYKIEPIEKFIKRELLSVEKGRRVPEDVHVEQWFGISRDELRRVQMSRNRWCTNIYPLIGLPDPMLPSSLDRQACHLWLRKTYPGYQVPRSACVGCPFKSNREWKHLQDISPEEFEDACQFDEAVRNCGGERGEVFLHRSATPLRGVDLRTPREKGQRGLFDQVDDDECDSGYCWM